MKINFDTEDKYNLLLPKIEKISNESYPINIWDIPQTITQLSYLTHGFFRYYGKFPSTVASQLLEQYPVPVDGVLIDNFAGSGTSLVEASRRGITSVGIDINPLSVLSGRVKTKLYNISRLIRDLSLIKKEYHSIDSCVLDKNNIPNEDYLEKWFFAENVLDIARLKRSIMNLEDSIELEFYTLAFLSIIRRVSKAFDGEVRPHVNKNKKPRDILKAFEKKVGEMIESIKEFEDEYPNSIPAHTYLIDNRIDYTNSIIKGNYWLAISHPPYLNCFDYIPVFKLELSWADGFDFLWDGLGFDNIKKMELKSWPAKGDLISSYYDGLKQGYEIISKLQKKGDKLAVVIGDCTINGKLECVHKKLMAIIEEIGYKTIELNYRTTNYTTGKYSYSHKANYHGENEDKKDSIIIFERE